MIPRILAIASLVPLLSCFTSPLQTSPLGRTQLRLFPADEMTAMGVAAYAQMKAEKPQSQDASAIRLVTCVARAVAAEAGGARAPRSWEITVFQDDSATAFALPGGKIGVHTGLLRVAADPSQLATVIGHEVAHVLADHGNERASTIFVAQSGLQLIEEMSGPPSPQRNQVLAVLGLGAEVGVLLPFSRTQEREADLLGLDLMAEAGFDPRASVPLWRNMGRAGGASPPEFLSTHPTHTSRIRELEERIPSALEIYERARSAGKRPGCA
jgi:predicted Zn-dependent protease